MSESNCRSGVCFEKGWERTQTPGSPRTPSERTSERQSNACARRARREAALRSRLREKQIIMRRAAAR